jgi:hypothetical protein
MVDADGTASLNWAHIRSILALNSQRLCSRIIGNLSGKRLWGLAPTWGQINPPGSDASCWPKQLDAPQNKRSRQASGIIQRMVPLQRVRGPQK